MRNTSNKKSTLPSIMKWSQLDWKSIKQYVEKLQQRIYRAESLGQKRKVRNLQRLLMHSKATLLISIKRVTQTNKGKKTPGIDGVIVLTEEGRMALFERMRFFQIQSHNPKPSYRAYVKKKNGKLRPLSIPTMTS